VLVEADVFADGHNQVACQILDSQDSEEFQSCRWRIIRTTTLCKTIMKQAIRKKNAP
jgi:hypothetical protein